VCSTDVQLLYRRIIQHINNIRRKPQQWKHAEETWEKVIFVIIERTLALRDLVNNINADTHQPEVLHCTKCINETPEKQCVRWIQVKLNEDAEFIKCWEGVGVTCVPLDERMKPRKGRKASNLPLIVHPDEIGLQKIARDKEVVDRCGKQIYLFSEDDVLKDFLWYNAFSRGPNGVFDRLVHYSKTPLGVQPVLQGNKFDFWRVGQMIPFGAREPSGGHLADHYTFYSGIHAETLWGITVLFEQAEMSATIPATARSVHPELVQKIRSQSKLCERVGYTAPQHRDKDATPSLCAQFILQAEEKWSEFGFCALQSFNSNLLHGTMLPSENTILRLRGGADSVGSHTTTRRRDERRAERNEQTRANYNLRTRAWEGRN
ncbi:MAG: hypothetical protein NXY57DRAFT_1044792, partial [Lentinula lateritia]